MLSAGRALRRGVDSGKVLPDVASLGEMHEAGIHFRLGQVVMITGRPGAGKSNLMQHLSTAWAKSGLPVLYFSLDMDAWTAGIRQAAAVSGHRQEVISEALDTEAGEGQYEALLAGLPIDFSFDTRPQLPDLQQELDAYVELNDRYPSVLVIDTLLNIDSGGEGGHQDYKFILKELQGLARQTGGTVFVLHHATESGVKDTTHPPTMAQTDSKVNQIPELILGVAGAEGELRLAALKVRSGARSDPEAKRVFRVEADFSTMQFGRPKHRVTGAVGEYWDGLE